MVVLLSSQTRFFFCAMQVLMSAMLSSQTKDAVTAAAVNRMREVNHKCAHSRRIRCPNIMI